MRNIDADPRHADWPKRRTDTHYVDYDAPGRLKRRAICGVYIRETDHRNDPTCPTCQMGLALDRATQAKENETE